MAQMFDGNQKIGDIVTQYPHSANLFKKYGVDFCCGGNRPLIDVLREKNLDEASVLEQLYEIAEQSNGSDVGKKWGEAPYREMIEHIIFKHHNYLREELPVLSDFVTKIARVHGRNHPELLKLHELYHAMKSELETHLVKEEDEQFPEVIKYEWNKTPAQLEKAVKAIGDLEAEHEAVGNILKEMRTLTSDYSLPPDACRTYTLSFRKLEDLESDLFEHIHLENNILFKRLLEEAK